MSASVSSVASTPHTDMDKDTALKYLWKKLSAKITEMKKALPTGASVVLLEEGTEKISGETCWAVALGVNTDEKFTAEDHYAVSPTGVIYVMDIATGSNYVKYETDVKDGTP